MKSLLILVIAILLINESYGIPYMRYASALSTGHRELKSSPILKIDDVEMPSEIPLYGEQKDTMLSFTLRIAGPICFIALQLSTLRTAFQIYVAKSVGGLSPLPFVSLLINSVVWALYGALKGDFTVFVPNASGAVVGLVCAYVYDMYSKEKSLELYLTSASILCMAIWLYTENDDSTIGILGYALSVALAASPLAVIRTVVRDRSTASLPFLTSLVLWFNSLSWLTYGYLIANDSMIYGPNAIGFILSTIQLLLFVAFGGDITKF